jgi:hypothetical protein
VPIFAIEAKGSWQFVRSGGNMGHSDRCEWEMPVDGAWRLAVRSGGTRHVAAAELARRQGVGPVLSPGAMARAGLFTNGKELQAFLDDLYATRRSGTE